MGERAETIAASSGGSENNQFRSCKAYHVGGSPEEDCRDTKSTVGEDTGAAEEGGVSWISSLGSLLRRERDGL